ncbi:hypothetical protein C0992_001725 [Termitomyces sp. T32_za158]|nr:hypothetical protein C0992_001725 [Termitomyces sp. T32_za158]
MVTGQMEQDKGKAPLVPPVMKKWGESGQGPQVRQKSLRKALDLEFELEFSDEEEDRRSLSTLSVQLQLLKLDEYVKHKVAQGTATSTATPAEFVDYGTLLHQCAPDIAEAMDILNAPRQANESQQDYERHQNATQRQANMSGMPCWALSEVETATSNPAGDDKVEELPEMKMPH